MEGKRRRAPGGGRKNEGVGGQKRHKRSVYMEDAYWLYCKAQGNPGEFLRRLVKAHAIACGVDIIPSGEGGNNEGGST